MMKRRILGLAFLTGTALLAVGVSGCSSDGSAKPAVEVGTLALPLSTQGPSGTTYRLRDAVFEIDAAYSYDSGGEGGTSAPTIFVSSEDDPNAESIRVELERGYHRVLLHSGWRLEKVEGTSVTDVEATLLSQASQLVYVREHSTSFVEYNFGLGDRELWFNGKVNISVNVYENPGDIYGYGGAGGDSGGGVAGEPTVNGGASF